MVNTPKHSVSVAGVVVDESGSVLVIQRQDNGHWEPPGGILELGESPIEGAKREVLEETGLEVEVDFLSGIYKNMSRGVVAIVFRAHQVGGSLRTSSESRRVEWRNVDEIENQMDPAYSIRIKDALAAGRPTVRIHDGEQLIVADPMNGDDFAESEDAEEADLQVEAFRFDASLDQLDGAVAALDEIYSQGNRHWEFLHQINDENLLQRNGLVARSPVVLELQDLIGYEIRIHGVSPANAVLMTRSHGDSRPAWPPPIKEKSPDVYALWSHLASRVSHPNSIARLEDLLFEARVGNRRERARRAIESYRAVFDASERDGTCAESILRAWELSRRVGDAVLEGELREMILNAAELEIANQGRAGLALPLLKAAGRWPRGAPRKDPRSYSPEQDERVDLILNRAFEALDARFASALVNVMKPRLRAGEAVLDLRRREVSAHRAEAHQASGFVKQVKLEEAVKIAKRYDLNDLAAEMIVEMQQIPRSELKMMSFSAPLQIPIDLRERMLNAYVETADWADGINAFLNSPPPTGDLDWLRQSARDSMRRSPLATMLRPRVMNAARMPTWQGADGGDSELHAMSMPAQIQAQFNGGVLGEGLVLIGERYKRPSREELVLALSLNGSSSVRIADPLARAFLLFWDHEYDAAAHLAVPQVEAAARLLLIELDEASYNIHIDESPSGYPYLSSLLNELERVGMDESWIFYLRWLLISPVGANMRNEIAHGLSGPVGRTGAALILRAATLLSSLTCKDQDGADDWPGARGLRPLQPRSRAEMIALLSSPVPDPVLFPNWPTVGGRSSLIAVVLRGLSRLLGALARATEK